jgi:predicted transcriptional regulator
MSTIGAKREVSMVEKIGKRGFSQDQLNKIKTLSSTWISLLTLLSGPTMALPLGAAVVAVYVANLSGVSKEVSLILNILASLASGIAGGAAVEWWKNFTGNTIVVKKGQSAVRNLTLIREKAKNIVARTRSKSSSDEIENLLGLLEKDLGNSIKDWHDILPAVLEVEALYARLDQKEKENERIRSEVEAAKAELEKEKTWKANEKEELNTLLSSKEKEAEELRMQINELKSITSTAASALTSAATPGSGWSGYCGAGSWGIVDNSPGGLSFATKQICRNCGKLYNVRAIGENGRCPECNKK